MLSEKDLQTLLEHSNQGQVLSVYLNTNPAEVNTEAAKLKLRNLIKTIDLPKDYQAVETYVDLEFDWAARGLAIFSDQDANFFQAYQFGVSVPNRAFIGDRPVIRPLAYLGDAFKGWGAVVVDMQGARLFTYNYGMLNEFTEITGDEVKQTKRGGGNAMPGRMGGANTSAKVENVIEKNIKEVIDTATMFFSRNHIRRIMISGSEENIARFKEELPKAWQSLVVGEFPMSMTANHQEVQVQAETVALATHHKITSSLVDQSITLAAKGANGVTGLIDTLNAIHEGRVKTLMVLQDFEQPGYRCAGCGYLTVQSLETCPFCQGNFDQIKSAVEEAVHETLRKNAEVKVIPENQALEGAGGIAAILRY